MLIKIKWNKEQYEFQIDEATKPKTIKEQLQQKTQVPLQRQKLYYKGSVIPDDDWGKVKLKDGISMVLMGSPQTYDDIEKEQIQKQDLLKSQQGQQMEHDEDSSKADIEQHYSVGLDNFGNTCYMNATLQSLYAIPELKEAIQKYHTTATLDIQNDIVKESQSLFNLLDKSETSFAPYKFFVSLKKYIPSFAQLDQQRRIPQQQDAEECLTALLQAYRAKVKDTTIQNGSSVMDIDNKEKQSIVDKLFYIQMVNNLECQETGEKYQEITDSFSLKCNIPSEVGHLSQGIKVFLNSKVEKKSQVVDKDVIFNGKAQITQLPAYLNIQLMRFDYRMDVKQGAKRLRKVQFPFLLDIYDDCKEDLQQQIKSNREEYADYEERAMRAIKEIKQLGKAGKKISGIIKQHEHPEIDQKLSNVPEIQHTGKYSLQAIITHQGRSLDTGHYVAWIKKNGQWIEYNDDKLILRSQEEISELAGGAADWHIAYLLFYKSVIVPQKIEEYIKLLS